MSFLKNLLLVMVTGFSFGVQASYEDIETEGVSYEALLQQMSMKKNDISEPDLIDQSTIRVGVGMVQSFSSIRLPGQGLSSVPQRGFFAALGIDLFSPRWSAEGTIVNFGESEFNRTQIATREFDLKMAYRSSIFGGANSNVSSHQKTDPLFMRAGLGLGSRTLRLTDLSGTRTNTTEYTTPASLVFLGLGSKPSHFFEFGIEAGYRNSLSEDTPEISALDLTFRIDGTF